MTAGVSMGRGRGVGTHGVRRAGRLAAIAAVGTIVVLATRIVSTRLRALSTVAPDLRTPLLLFPIAPASLGHARLIRRLLTGTPVPTLPGIEISSMRAWSGDRTPVRVLTVQRSDRSNASAGLVWIHGGGTVIGTPKQALQLCARFVDEVDVVVACPEYRLAPEHPYPEPLEDCYTALCWMHEHAAELGIDPNRIAVGGDSAGGLLAAATTLLARDRGGPAIRFQLLEYPMLDDRTVLRDVGPEQSFVWSPAASRFGWTSYLGHPPNEHDAVSPYASPARAQDLSLLPAAWIGVGTLDLLHDEAVDYARRLTDADVHCDLHVAPDMYHGADSIRPNAPTSRAFRDEMALALARHLSRDVG